MNARLVCCNLTRPLAKIDEDNSRWIITNCCHLRYHESCIDLVKKNFNCCHHYMKNVIESRNADISSV